MCDFPVSQLLAYRARITAGIDALPDHEIRPRMQSILHIDQLRWLHEDIDGCECCHAAGKSVDAEILEASR